MVHRKKTHSRKSRSNRPRTRSKARTHTFRGGMWGHIIKQAAVPFGILAMQQTYKRKNKRTKTRHNRSKSTRKRS